MKKIKTVSQLSKELDVPKQTLQGWIDAILDTHKTGQGIAQHFDEMEIKKIRMIKEIKDYNGLCKNKKDWYTNSEIKKIIYGKSTDFNYKTFHEKYLNKLKKRREEYDRDIDAQEAILETGITPEIILNLNSKWNYDKTIKYLSLIGKNFRFGKSLSDEYDDLISKAFTDEEVDILIEALENTKKLYAEKYSYYSEEVQLKITEIHKIISKVISESVIFFEGVAVWLMTGDEPTVTCDETLFFINAVKYYCTTVKNSDNEIDKVLTESFENLYKFCVNKKSPFSAEVQWEIEQICGILTKIEIVSKDYNIILLDNIKDYFLLRSDEYILCKKKNVKVYIFRYIANSFQIYCENYKRED
ncbi:MAG: hypothetical protein NC395_04370 [Prevotella sp.]|nr:hypothetical protein [Prevotella sp.]